MIIITIMMISFNNDECSYISQYNLISFYKNINLINQLNLTCVKNSLCKSSLTISETLDFSLKNIRRIIVEVFTKSKLSLKVSLFLSLVVNLTKDNYNKAH